MVNTLDDPVRFSGIVVTYNDARHLDESMTSLGFCDELIVIDMGSRDKSVDIANKHSADVYVRNRVPIVEEIREEAFSLAKHDWIVNIDPDEVLPSWTYYEITEEIRRCSNTGAIQLPWQFYFRGKLLTTTVWGVPHSKIVVVNRNRVEIEPHVHRGITVLDGFYLANLHCPSPYKHGIKHYWIDSYRELIEKHWRYISKEGEARYSEGERFSWKASFFQTWQTLRFNLEDLNGFKGGLLGIGLSLFYTAYIGMSLLSLRSYSKKKLIAADRK